MGMYPESYPNLPTYLLHSPKDNFQYVLDSVLRCESIIFYDLYPELVGEKNYFELNPLNGLRVV